MTRRPDNISLFAFMCAGIYCAYLTSYRPAEIFSVCIVFAFLIFIEKLRLFATLFFTGAVLFLASNINYLKADKSAGILNGREITIYGKIISSQNYGRSSQAVIRTDSIQTGHRTVAAKINVSSYINSSDLFRNDRIAAKGKFTIPGCPTNLYQRDLRPLYLTENISGQLEKSSVISIGRTDSFSRKINSLQKKIIEVFDRRLSYRAGNFMSAVMIGRRDRLDRSVVKDFAGSGAIHLLAVSGLHVGFLVLILTVLSSVVGLKGWTKIIISSAALFFYAVFTGGSSSVIRAVLMAVILMLSYPMNRKLRFIDVVGTAGMISLIYDPNQIFGAGFILSFGAAASIAVIYAPVSESLKKLVDHENIFLRKAYDGIILSVSVTIGLLPFILYMFGRYNFVSIFSNVLLIPLTALSFMSGMVLLALDKIDIAAIFVADIINLCVHFINSIVSFTNGIEVMVLKYKPDILISSFLISASVMIFYFKNYKIKALISLILAAVLIYKISVSQREIPSVYEFHTKYNDTVIIEDCGRSVLVAGNLSRSEINNIIKPYLLNRNINEIDYLVSFREWYETENLISELGLPVRFLATYDDDRAFSGYSEYINLRYSDNMISTGNIRIIFNNKQETTSDNAGNVPLIKLKTEKIRGKMTEIR